MLINAGIKRVVYTEGYPDPLAQEMWEESKVVVEQFQPKPLPKGR